MTVADMSARMPHPEYVLWTRYYSREQQRRELEAKMAGAT